MMERHMIPDGVIGAGPYGPGVTRYALVIRKNLDRAGRHPDLHDLPDPMEGHTVVAFVNDNVIMGVHGRVTPITVFEGMGG